MTTNEDVGGCSWRFCRLTGEYRSCVRIRTMVDICEHSWRYLLRYRHRYDKRSSPPTLPSCGIVAVHNCEYNPVSHLSSCRNGRIDGPWARSFWEFVRVRSGKIFLRRKTMFVTAYVRRIGKQTLANNLKRRDAICNIFRRAIWDFCPFVRPSVRQTAVAKLLYIII